MYDVRSWTANLPEVQYTTLAIALLLRMEFRNFIASSDSPIWATMNFTPTSSYDQ